MKKKNFRKTGIDIIGDVPWGTHLCQFYKTKEDLVDILAPYFKAGLENNEFCIWVTSEALSEKETGEAMRKIMPDFDQYLKKGQIEIVPYTQWYLKDGIFNLQRVFNAWINKLNQSLTKGYDGIRVAGNTAWLEQKDWADFIDYEEKVNKTIDQYQMIAICTYSLDKCGASEIIDVVNSHKSILVRREGKWECLENSERKKTEEEKIKTQVIMIAEQKKKVMAEKMAEKLKKEVEEKTQEVKEESQLRERFIADASHELRTPLSVLQTNLDLLSSLGNAKKPFAYKDIKDSVEVSKNQIKNLTAIIEELSLLSRGKKPKELREKVKIETLIQEMAEELRPLAEAREISYKVNVIDRDSARNVSRSDAGGLEIMGDEDMLRKLVRNLISNAIKYSNRKDKIRISLRKQKGEAELQVSDNGLGISKKDLPYIFERFYRTDKGRSKEKGGIGLGLAICKWITELHGGKIGVESQYGKGSTFKVSLPLKGSWEDKVGFWDYKIRKGVIHS
ncbi:MAG: MEDS domain-containing protein [Candidatus Kuenenbacteria bacterium]